MPNRIRKLGHVLENFFVVWIWKKKSGNLEFKNLDNGEHNNVNTSVPVLPHAYHVRCNYQKNKTEKTFNDVFLHFKVTFNNATNFSTERTFNSYLTTPSSVLITSGGKKFENFNYLRRVGRRSKCRTTGNARSSSCNRIAVARTCIFYIT